MASLILRTIGTAVFAACGIAQFFLFWRLMGEHKRVESKVWFFIGKIPVTDDLTPRGLVYRKWWWRISWVAVAAFLLVVLSWRFP